MANTYHQMYVQAVFAVKYRAAIIEKPWRHQFMAVIGNLVNETGCKNIIVNGVVPKDLGDSIPPGFIPGESVT
ncbi:MAG: hypothetical protein R6U46_14165 [Marinilabilia sp.]